MLVLSSMPFLLCALAACTSSVGGSGGSGGAGAGAGGTATNACPSTAPQHGDPCTGSHECPYSADSCAGSVDVARCEGGNWVFPRIAACAAPADCDVTGDWLLHLAWETDMWASFSPNDFALPITQDGEGHVLVAGPRSVTLAGCTLTAHWVLDHDEGEIDGEWFSTSLEQHMTLTFAEGTVSGTAKRDCWGECGGEDIGAVTGTLSP